jgi:hypothetical protein
MHQPPRSPPGIGSAQLAHPRLNLGDQLPRVVMRSAGGYGWLLSLRYGAGLWRRTAGCGWVRDQLPLELIMALGAGHAVACRPWLDLDSPTKHAVLTLDVLDAQIAALEAELGMRRPPIPPPSKAASIPTSQVTSRYQSEPLL